MGGRSVPPGRWARSSRVGRQAGHWIEDGGQPVNEQAPRRAWPGLQLRGLPHQACMSSAARSQVLCGSPEASTCHGSRAPPTKQECHMCSQPPPTTQEGMAEAVALAAASADVPAHACQAPAFIKSPWSFHQPWLKGTTCRSVTCAAMFPQATTRAWLGLKLWQLPLQTCLSMLAKECHLCSHVAPSSSQGMVGARTLTAAFAPAFCMAP